MRDKTDPKGEPGKVIYGILAQVLIDRENAVWDRVKHAVGKERQAAELAWAALRRSRR